MVDFYLIYVVAGVIAVLPTAIVFFAKPHIIERRKEMLATDFRTRNVNEPTAFDQYVTSRGGIEALQRQVQDYMGQDLWLHLATLLILNSSGLALSIHYFQTRNVPEYLPVIYAFMGAYLLNFGVIIRRISLADLNAQMLRSAVSRLLLATGLSIVLQLVPGAARGPEIFFAVGFLSNLFLSALLNSAQKLAKIRVPKRNDGMSLQMVRGIDFWKEYRLEEEGIEDVQNLATADALDLAVQTHYNLSTLVDWIDQALVILRFRDRVRKLEDAGFSISAIDLAWSSPLYTGTTVVAEEIARTLTMNPIFVIAQLNSLYEDQHVRNLWILWQTRAGFNESPDERAKKP